MNEMAEAIRRRKAFFYMLKFAGAKPSARIEILRNINPQELKAFMEIAVNALHGVIPLSREQKKLLRNIKPFIVYLVSDQVSLKKKKVLLVKYHKQAHQLLSVLFNTLQKLVWHRM